MAELTYLHVGREAIGYGRLGVKLAEALRRRGVTLYESLGDPPPDRGEPPSPSDDIVREAPSEPTAAVSWISVPGHARWWWEGQHTSIFTMWEASFVPETFRESLHEFTTIIVPSKQNVELFSQYHPNVRYCPLGIDPAQWSYLEREPVDNEFRFLIGGSGPRKGVDLAYKAFRAVFPNPERLSPRPRLVMKNPKGEDYYGNGIDMVSGRLSAQEERDLYAHCHAYIQPSRGEGFGLQPLQAMAQGMPTILTNAHGHEAFAGLAQYPLGWKWTKAEYFTFGDAGDWWEPDFEQLCEAMWDVYFHYDEAFVAAETTAQIVGREFTWDRTAGHYLEALDGVYEQPRLTTREKQVPDIKFYRIRVKIPWRSEVAGFTYVMAPGVDYWVPADLKRTYFEVGILDPDCLDVTKDGPDLGLTVGQLSQLGAYTAEQAYCPTCHQQLNSQRTKADVELEKIEAADDFEAALI